MEFTKGEHCSKGVMKFGWNHQCSKKVIIERDGKHYCKIHDPEYIREKQRKWDEKFNKKWDEDHLRYARNDAIRQACMGLTTVELTPLKPNRVKASNAMYEALKVLVAAEFGVIEKHKIDKALIALAEADEGAR